MSYVTKVLTKGEKLLYITRPHWIYLFEGIFWFLTFVSAGLFLEFYLQNYIPYGHAIRFHIDLKFIEFDERHTPIPWLFGLCGFALFWPLFLGYLTTEVGLTSQRIIWKKGLMFIEMEQVDLDDIRAEHVSHGLLGWLLRYGKIRLDCRFVEDISLPVMRNPYKLIKAAHVARMKHPDIEFDHNDLQRNLQRVDEQKQLSQKPPVMAYLKKARSD